MRSLAIVPNWQAWGVRRLSTGLSKQTKEGPLKRLWILLALVFTSVALGACAAKNQELTFSSPNGSASCTYVSLSNAKNPLAPSTTDTLVLCDQTCTNPDGSPRPGETCGKVEFANAAGTSLSHDVLDAAGTVGGAAVLGLSFPDPEGDDVSISTDSSSAGNTATANGGEGGDAQANGGIGYGGDADAQANGGEGGNGYGGDSSNKNSIDNLNFGKATAYSESDANAEADGGGGHDGGHCSYGDCNW